jgi:hypothetical protein
MVLDVSEPREQFVKKLGTDCTGVHPKLETVKIGTVDHWLLASRQQQ